MTLTKIEKVKNRTSTLQKIARISLGILMVLAGIGHLSFQRKEFRAQVPNWIPLNPDTTVLASGVVEIALGLSMILSKKQRPKVGWALALFYVAVFPGNISQYLNQRDAFGLNSDKARLARLFFQPILIYWAIWSTGAISYLKQLHSGRQIS
ncbi:MAG: DoxX family membrane protein [Flavobacteriales bacterium]|nr:MAG: DoxX family membrane protein [Flavobacteriales bacterium]